MCHRSHQTSSIDFDFAAQNQLTNRIAFQRPPTYISRQQITLNYTKNYHQISVKSNTSKFVHHVSTEKEPSETEIC